MVYVRPVVLRCTRRALNLLDGHRSLAKLPPSDDDWCLNLLWLDRGKCLLLTHAGTLFSVFVANVRAAGLRSDRRLRRRGHRGRTATRSSA